MRHLNRSISPLLFFVFGSALFLFLRRGSSAIRSRSQCRVISILRRELSIKAGISVTGIDMIWAWI